MPRLPYNRPLDRLDAKLMQAGRHRTPQMVAVYQSLLRNAPCAPLTIVNDLSTQVSRRTVYRCLNILEDLKVIRALSKQVYDLQAPFRSRNLYLVCGNCGGQIPYFDAGITTAIEQWAERHGGATNWLLRVDGVCGLCRHNSEHDLPGARPGQFN